ncbi:hypothetical protein GCM10011416_17830 [Polaribacter pacificus]|uniref:Type IV secretion system putative lipoprotein virB7 n=1 Tax=Polaribacter pacificus TaxID=1775173 RepID=A0A917I0J9_9FLAO|nr:lipoprotein [Polaribacter pacificus]GGG99831.1 hypothetical protein GCM10011416_17830 [Polaribacter pacificus]
MKKIISFFVFIIVLTSCNEVAVIDNNNQFKKGVFEIPAGEGYSKTIITRVDSLQIEEYTKSVSISTDSTVSNRLEKRIDTLYIKWKNNFSYTLQMKNPKTALDKDLIFVTITKVTDNSFDFIARIGYSDFKQKGTVYKVK